MKWTLTGWREGRRSTMRVKVGAWLGAWWDISLFTLFFCLRDACLSLSLSFSFECARACVCVSAHS